jgi:hypothetical protein
MLAPGTKLGPYEVPAPLGAGGMGEVYRGRDTRLGRDVAIPAENAGNLDGLLCARRSSETRVERWPGG